MLLPQLELACLVMILLPLRANALHSLANPSLLASIASNGPTFPVFDPAAPSTELATVPLSTRDDVKRAIDRSYKVLPDWRDGTTGMERGRILQKWSSLIQDHADSIATIMTLESGKPRKESLGEVNYATSFLDYYAAEAIRPSSAGGGFLTPTPFANPRGKVLAQHQAVGVTGLITPWNFPAAMITRKVGPALAAGCTAIVKPSEWTPLTAVALVELARQAGLPKDVVQLVTPDTQHTPEVGLELCTNPLVRKISFTGSTRVGRLLMEQSNLQRMSLELGGNAVFCVLEDADLEVAVSAAMASKFRHAGQTCVCADRFLVHESVYDEFLSRFKEAVESQLVVGPGMESSTTMGPLISEEAVRGVHSKVTEAIGSGARLVTGGEKLESIGTHFYAPTILSDVSTTSSIWSTETFGPVAAVRSFATEEEALDIANDSNTGLAAYFCTRDLKRAWYWADR